MKPQFSISTATAWVIGRPSAAAQLINQLNPISCRLAIRKANTIDQLTLALRQEATVQQTILFVPTTNITFADLDALHRIHVRYPHVHIAVCFSSAHLGTLSYAWALDFAAYYTVDDSSTEIDQLTRRLIDEPSATPLYSTVFCAWLQQYGILFKHDHWHLL